MTENKAVQALVSGDIAEARDLIRQGAKLEGSYLENNLGQVFRNIFGFQAFDLVQSMVGQGIIITDIYELDRFDRSVFKHFCNLIRDEESHIDFLSNFLQKVSNINDEVSDQTLLGFCLEEGADPAMIRCLIDAGCDVNYRNNAEQNFVHRVIVQNMMRPERSKAYLDMLIAEGIDINAPDISGSTPLMIAVKKRNEEQVALLLEQGADSNIQDKSGNTAFYYAVAEQMDSEIYALMTQYTTPNFELTNRDDQTILSQYLRLIGGSEGETALLEKLLQDGADLTVETPHYGEPKSGLAWVAEKNPALLQRLLALGNININAQDNAGNTLLHTVCGINVNFSAEAARNIYRKAKMLLEAGADPAITNDKDETALMLAQNDNLKIKTVELLMQHKG